jgi:hypothetical protein
MKLKRGLNVLLLQLYIKPSTGKCDGKYTNYRVLVGDKEPVEFL